MIPGGLDPVVILKLTYDQVEQVTCIECCKYYIAPETASCGHTLCHVCWIGRHSCPTCAAPLNRKALKLNIPMRMLTEHVHALADSYEKVFGLKLDEFSVDMLENSTDGDPTKNVKQWLASSQNHFSAPILSTQQSTQDITNPEELSANKIQIHAHNDEESPKIGIGQKTGAYLTKVVYAHQGQEDWDKIEILPDTEENIPKNKHTVELMDKEIVLNDDEYTTENPRRSSRKRDVNGESDIRTRDTSIDKQSWKNSSCETDLKSAKAKQNWTNVKKMRKEFSKLNKKNKNKLNVSIEMCKKNQSAVSKLKHLIPVDPIALLQPAYKIDDSTPVINNERVAVTTKDTVNTISSDDLLNNNNKKDNDNGVYKSIKNKPEEVIKSNESLTKNNNSALHISNTKIANIPISNNSSIHHKTADGVKITQTEIDPKTVGINLDDIEISIKIGNVVTNIFIKKKEKDVQLKVNTDREIQTDLGPYVHPPKNDASCSPIKIIKVNSLELGGKEDKPNDNLQLSKSTPAKKNTEDDDTATAPQYEITESVEKELSDLMECVETDNAKDKVTIATSSKSIQIANSLHVKGVAVPEKVREITEGVEHSNDLDIFGSGSVKEVNVQLLKTAKYAGSEILPTYKSKKSQKVADKRNRDINNEMELPRNKKQKLDFNKIGEMSVEVLVPEEKNEEVANDSENMNFDAIMSQAFANIDADLKFPHKNTQDIKNSDKKSKNSHMQINASGSKSKNNLVAAEAGDDSKLKELIHQKCSENVFSMLEKDSEDINVSNKNVEQPPLRVSTQEHIENLLTPGMCRDLASSARDEPPENDDVVVIGPALGTPMEDQDDSDKSVVEETPQKNLSLSKTKQKSDASNKSSGHKRHQRKSVEKLQQQDSQIIRSIINISDTSADSDQNTVVEKKKLMLGTPLTMNNFYNHIKHNSTPVVRKSLNFNRENLDDLEETVCPTQGKQSSEQTLCPTTTQEMEFLTKAFEQTPKSPVKRPLALKSVKNKENIKLCLAGSCLKSTESESLKILCKIRGWSYVEKYTNSLTHLVVGVDEENRSKRSLKYMCALAASKWIVSFAWAEECLRTKYKVDELPYEALDGSGDPGPMLSRVAQRKLFEGFTFYCMPPFGILDVETLKYILEASGGRVVAEAEDVRLTDGGGAPALLLAEPEHTQEDRFLFLALKLHIVPLNYEWVLNCLGCYALGSIHELLLCPSILLPPAVSLWPPEMLRESDDE